MKKHNIRTKLFGICVVLVFVFLGYRYIKKQAYVSPIAVPTVSEEVASATCLKDIYAKEGILIGTCLSPQHILSEENRQVITKQFNSITLENYMKPDYIFNQQKSKQTGDLVVEFSSTALSLLSFAKENGMKLRGHTLIWHSQTPSWIFTDNFESTGTLVDRETMLCRMESYIKQVFETIEELGYSDLFYAYDVVNEGILEDGNLRSTNSYWYQIIGEDYIWYAFYYADQYAPENISLFYNDYNEEQKVLPITHFVQTLVDKDGNSLIDGIGLQAHLFLSVDVDTYLEALRSFCELGLEIQITELDIGLGAYGAPVEPTESRMKEQGQYYYKLLSGIVEIKKELQANITAVTFWGFQDSLSWRSEYAPVLYDCYLNPKYSFYGAARKKEYAGF